MEQTERDKLIMLNQKLDDHIATQNSDMNDLKSGMTRIETKLDYKAGKDDLDKLAAIASAKVDREALQPVKEKIDILDTRFWWAVTVTIMAFISIIVYIIQNHFRN